MEEIRNYFLDTTDPVPVFPYGGVYFRKSNPPEEDWERDYQTAAELGVNIMRHWFMWAVIEVAPGEYDWRDYDIADGPCRPERHQGHHWGNLQRSPGMDV